MSNISKLTIRKTTVAILTLLLVIAIAAPLVTFASAAAPTAKLSKTSGPNGTLVSVTGSGFHPGDVVGDISISVDGHAAGANTYTSSIIGSKYQLATDANGALTGYFIIYGLTVGAHTIIISDDYTSVQAGTFTITKPTVTITPSTVSGGSSVLVTASGFPTSAKQDAAFSNKIMGATFSGNVITVIPAAYTNHVDELSSNVMTKDAFGSLTGGYTGTVSLPGIDITKGPVFTLTDNWGNTATTTLTTSTTTVTLSPTSGPVGTWVTATLTGFGPNATIVSTSIGNTVGHFSYATQVRPASTVVTEQGSAVFLFQIPAGDNDTQSGAAGAQTVVVSDDRGNFGASSFTVTPKVAITLGSASTDSKTAYVPQTTSNVVARISATGFKPEAPLTITASPNVPAAWTVPSTATWTTNQINTDGKLVADKNGQVNSVITAAGTSPTSIGQYWIAISDGTTTVTTTIYVVAPGNIMAVPKTSGAVGQTAVQVIYFGTTPTGVSLSGSTVTATSLPAASAWPTPATGEFTIVSSTAGVHTLALTGATFNSVAFTILSTSVTVINPASASVGTTVTVVGTGYANTALALTLEGATIPGTASIAENTLIATFDVPNYLPGTYTLSVSDSANTATTTFTVASPSITINPSKSAPSDKSTFSITGSGFNAKDGLLVYFDSTLSTPTKPVGLTVVNTNGGILIDQGFPILAHATAGAHTITVVGYTGASATATYTITSKLGSLVAVRPGASVAVNSGVGFAANSVETLLINGTATTWLNVGTTPASALAYGTTVKTNNVGDLDTGLVGFVVSATETSTALNVTVVDAAGNSASTMLTILATPTITVGSSNVVAGTPIEAGVSLSGEGFTPSSLRVGGTPITAVLLSGSTVVAAVTLSDGPYTVGDDGVFEDVAFAVPSTVPAGEYTLQVTVGSAGVSTPVETASTTITVMGAPTVTAPTTVASGSNVTITVTGLTKITSAMFGSKDLLTPAGQFGSTKISNEGADAYTTTTWFIVPTTVFAGTYLLTVTDSQTGLSAQQAITVTPVITIDPTTGIKGTDVEIVGSGFSPSSIVNATVNGAKVALHTHEADALMTETDGSLLTIAFYIPISAVATNTIVVTDASGNQATATFTLTVPTITLSPTSVSAGNAVQIVGDGFSEDSIITVQINGQVVATSGNYILGMLISNFDGSFMTYATVPAGVSGNVTVTATDQYNNVGTAYLDVNGQQSTVVPNQTTMSSTAQTSTSSGTATTTFTAGSTVKASFILQTASGSRDVVVAATWQQGATVYNMASFQTTMDTTARTVSFSNLAPVGATGTWTVTLQVFASDGVTPLAVQTLTFTVS